ncbi:Bacteroides conjugative transposon TraK protein [Xylanibacter ruminicola]|uniref:conjugative transposon protein TraK n=1 Tax=Xylanibacter ruminicola TaxID=839 RepID=UPI0008E76C84|nr:conjugative transposon protein TraK [Xylanibacter ruminicola]SFC49823.1 Bacteroides conjugative transposon TraK protein [Xylanibacter ruminicola]
MLIESLEKKTRLAMVTVMLALGASTVICAACFYFCMSLVREQQNQVYVLDGTIPFMAERSKNEMTFNIEAKAHIQLFHQYFFDLSPDDEYLKWTFSKAMYLADESALRQKQAIEETGFYSQLLSSSAVETIICDSIKLNEEEMSFTYYGTQMIKRRTNSIRRSITTVGRLQNVPRTQNNPHGLMITNWRTLENKDLKSY